MKDKDRRTTQRKRQKTKDKRKQHKENDKRQKIQTINPLNSELIKARETFIELLAEKVETQVSSSILTIIFNIIIFINIFIIITIFIIININIIISIFIIMTIIAINKPRSHWSRVSKNHPNF